MRFAAEKKILIYLIDFLDYIKKYLYLCTSHKLNRMPGRTEKGYRYQAIPKSSK